MERKTQLQSILRLDAGLVVDQFLFSALLAKIQRARKAALGEK
jgi:hypothetical protein